MKKLLTPIVALVACVLLAGCDDQEYNETGAVPRGDTDEYATDTETDGDTDAIIILDDTADEPEMAEQENYRAAKPAVDEPTDQPSESGDQAAQPGNETSPQARQGSDAQTKEATSDAEADAKQSDNQTEDQSPDADEADVVDEIE